MGHQNQTNQGGGPQQAANLMSHARSSSFGEQGVTRANVGIRRDDVTEPQDVAVFFDFENIVYSTRNCLNLNPDFGLLMDCCRSFGRVVIARAYADWRRHAPAVSSILHAQDIDPVFVPSYQYGRTGANTSSIKNSVDMHLCVDAMRALYRYPHLSAFVLISGDRDFIPLVRALRMEGKLVIGVGVADTTSNYLGRAVDQFVFYQDLLTRSDPTPRPAVKPETETPAAPAAEAPAVPPPPNISANGNGRTAPIGESATAIAAAADEDGLWHSLLFEADGG